MTKNTQSLLPLVKLNGSPKVVVTEEVYNQIRYLCEEIPTVEWSGVLFHTSKGDLTKPETFICTTKYILPMHKGTSGYTEYNFDSNYTEAIVEKPELLEYRSSHIHSHNNMATFFSGTDNEELQDNGPLYDYYLSLIVNNKGDYTCRIAFKAKVSGRKILVKGSNNKIKTITTPDSEAIFYYDCDVIEERTLYGDEFFLKHVKRIVEFKPSTVNTGFSDNHGFSTFSNPKIKESAQHQLDFGKRESSDTGKKEYQFGPNTIPFVKYLLVNVFSEVKGISVKDNISEIIGAIERYANSLSKAKKEDLFELASNDIDVYYEKYFQNFASQTDGVYYSDEDEITLDSYTYLQMKIDYSGPKVPECIIVLHGILEEKAIELMEGNDKSKP